MQMSYDVRDGRKASIVTIEDPAWHQVEAAIRALNEQTHTEVALVAGDQLLIGGGGGRYFVTAFTEDERSLILEAETEGDDGASAAETQLVSGGQRIAIPVQQAVQIDMALRAAQTFCERKVLDDTLTWREE